MKLSSFDDCRILCVDYRYEREKQRLWELFGQRNVKATFFIDGRGYELPRDIYNQISLPQPATWMDGTSAFNHFRAFKRMIAEARDSNKKSLLIAEDDVVFNDNFDEIVEMLNVPDDWDMLYYGANHSGHPTQKVGDNLLRCFGSQTTHLVAFRDTIYNAVLSLPADRTIDWSIGQRLHKDYNCYAVFPAIAIQKPGYSHLWNRQVDYTKLWEDGGIPV